MNKKVYLLSHLYEIEEFDVEEGKTLGIYSTKEKAEEAIEFYFVQTGFCNHPRSCFCIDEYSLDVNQGWSEGFITWGEVYDSLDDDEKI